ncbi:DUF4190 domain-containing protein [Streptomyces yerevanensis]|uniref:DUF4190 domain-containing protein n=1 Tax=Streptomyces yerevanensis TaxID=66378 RepID=UPI0007C4DF6C|nr:DUF4190 domain-containing protein [Streptomyces yerevanensis]
MHDQPTVTSIPGAGTPPSPGGAQPWANPVAPPAASGPGNPFAGPGGTPPNPSSPSNPSGNPFAAPGGGPGEPVPPPPISPEGPGQASYGYGYGYQGQPYYPAAPGAGPGYGWPGMPMAPSNGMGTTGMVLGIISAVGFCLWPVAIILGVLAVIFGAIGRGKARRGEATNAGQALAGIICGAVGIVLGVAMFVLVIIAPGLLDDSETDYSNTGDDGFNTSLVAER